MKLEKLTARPLSEEEEFFKKAYLSNHTELWSKPMTSQEYDVLVQSGTIPAPPSNPYLLNSKDGQGNTVREIQSPYNVDITIHSRYAYPLLHNHEYIEIIYVAHGTCDNLFSDFTLQMKQGDVCIMSPFTMHALSCTNEDSCIINLMVSRKFFNQNFLYTIMSGQTTASYLEEILYHRESVPYILFPTGQDTWLAELARRLITEITHKRQAFEYSISLLASSFLIHLTREYEVYACVPSKQTSAPNDLIISILGYLSVNYNCTSLSKLADFFGYSDAYLSRFIHENVGKTFNQILCEIQMEHARELLKDSTLSLTEIATEVGCFDSSHFSKKFHSIYGITPREYRKSL